MYMSSFTQYFALSLHRATLTQPLQEELATTIRPHPVRSECLNPLRAARTQLVRTMPALPCITQTTWPPLLPSARWLQAAWTTAPEHLAAPWKEVYTAVFQSRATYMHAYAHFSLNFEFCTCAPQTKSCTCVCRFTHLRLQDLRKLQ